MLLFLSETYFILYNFYHISLYQYYVTPAFFSVHETFIKPR